METIQHENEDYFMFKEDEQMGSKYLTLKQKIFNLCSIFLPKTFLPPAAAAVLIFASFIQLFGLMITVGYNDDDGFRYLLRSIYSFRILPEIENLESSFLYYSFLSGTFFVVVFLFINAVLNSIFNSTAYVSTLFPMIYWACFVPILELIISVFQCNGGHHIIVTDVSCFGSEHLFIMAIAGTIALIWLPMTCLTTLIVSYSQTYKNDPFAHFPWNFELLYFALRILFVINARISQNNFFQVILVIITFLYFTVILWETYPYYDPLVSSVFCGCSGSMICISLFVLLKYSLDVFNIPTGGAVMFMLIASLLLFVLIYWSQKRWHHKLITKRKLIDVYENDMKIHMLIEIMAKGVTYIEGQNRYLESDPTVTHPSADANSSLGSSRPSSSGSYNIKTIIENDSSHEILCSLIRQCEKENIGGGTDIHFLLQMSSIYLYIMQNIQMAYIKIIEAEQLDGGLFLDFAMHLKKIEILTAIETMKKKAIKKLGHCRFQIVIQYEAELSRMQQKMDMSANCKIEFWSSLKEKPSLNKLHNLGMEMIKLNREVKGSWKLLCDLNNRNMQGLRLYRQYMKYIIGDIEETKTLQKQIGILSVEREYKSLSIDAMFLNKVATIITSSESKILRINKAGERIFMYDKKQLYGHPISMLMPPLIGKNHSEFMDLYFKTGISQSEGKPFLSFGLDREGFIFPLHITIQKFFSLSLGMLYVGAIETNRGPTEDQYIITNSRGLIGGITRKTCRKLSITPSMLSDKKLNITKLCPQLSKSDITSLLGETVLGFINYTKEPRAAGEVPRRNAVLANRQLEDPSVPSNRNSLHRKDSIMDFSLAAFSDNVDLLTLRANYYEAKVDIVNREFSTGLVMKVFKVGKQINKQDSRKRRKKMIGQGVISSISTILKAYRKFKAVLLRSKNMKSDSCAHISSASVLIKPRRSENLPVLKSLNQPKEEEKAQSSGTKRIMNEETGGFGDTVMRDTKITLEQTTKVGFLNDKSNQKGHSSPPAKEVLNHISLDARPIVPKNRAQKEVMEMRNKTIEEFNPDSIKHIKIANGLFVFLVLVLLAVRIIISISLNTAVVNYSPLMKSNGDRISLIACVGLYTEIVTNTYFHKRFNATIIDTTAHDKEYDFKAISGLLQMNASISSYKDFAIERLKFCLLKLSKSQSEVDKEVRGYSQRLVNLINVPNLEISSTIGGKYVNYSMSILSTLNTAIDNTYKILDMINKGTYSNDEYMEDMVVSNLLTNAVKAVRGCLDVIVSEAYSTSTLQDSFSLASMISIVIIYVAYFLVLVPFLYMTRKNLSSMLLLLLNIPKQEITEEHDKALRFKKKLHKNQISGQEAQNSDEEGRFRREQCDARNAGIDKNSGQEKPEEKEEDDELNEVEDEKDKEKKPDANKKKKHSEKSGQSYTEHKSNVWNVLFIFGFFSCFAIGIYVVLDYFSKTNTINAAFKIVELRYLSRNLYATSYSTPYLYNYILTNKEGNCGSGTCKVYLPSYYALRIQELNAMFVVHTGNTSLLDAEYENFYLNIFENDACANTAIGKNPNCTTMMGGIVRKGAYAAAMHFADLTFSIFRDFERCNGTLEDILKFANDKRLIDIEILDLLYITPLFNLMIDYVMKELPNELREGTTLTVSLLSAFIIVFVVTTIWWLLWLIGFMRGSMYDTKSLLANLPDDIILQNPTIYSHLSKFNS